MASRTGRWGRLVVAAWSVWGLLGAAALAEAPRPLPSGFPNRTIRFITWSSPGGGGDVLGRQMIEAIRRQNLLSVPVVIENRPGGSGAVAMAHVLQQPADGYTVLIVTKNLTLTPITRKLNYDYRSFKPIQRSQVEPFFVAVRANAPWKNLRELAEDAGGAGLPSEAPLRARRTTCCSPCSPGRPASPSRTCPSRAAVRRPRPW